MSRMMSNCDSDRLSPDEEFVERHHKENKELQGKLNYVFRIQYHSSFYIDEAYEIIQSHDT